MTLNSNESISGQVVSVADHLAQFHQSYSAVHGYVSLVVSVVGVVCNAFIIIVLRHRSMVNSTNVILTALAVSDMATMVSYVPFALQFYCLHGTRASPRRNTLHWMRFVLFHAHLSVTSHTTSIWLGVLLSIFRYSFVRSTASGEATSDQIRTTKVAIGSVVVTAIVCLLPNYLSLTILQVPFLAHRHPISHNRTRHDNVTAGTTSYADDFTPMDYVVTNDVIGNSSRSNGFEEWEVGTELEEVLFIYEVVGVDVVGVGYGRLVMQLNFWIHALFIKLIPCALMFAFGLRILCAVRTTHRASARLRINSTRMDTRLRRQREHNRTTSMLIVVIILFLVTELPQGMLALLSGVVGDRFFERYYAPLGDVMDIMALVNNGINFTLYCAMSTKFRQTFVRLFCPVSRATGGENGGPWSGQQQQQQRMQQLPTTSIRL